jgi:hypothetical protein
LFSFFIQQVLSEFPLQIHEKILLVFLSSHPNRWDSEISGVKTLPDPSFDNAYVSEHALILWFLRNYIFDEDVLDLIKKMSTW